MNEMAYFELFGRISDKYVTEALIPAVIPVPAPKKGFRQTPLGQLVASPAFIAVVGAVAAIAIAVAVGLGLAGQGRHPSTDTEAPSSHETLWESDDDSQSPESDEESDDDSQSPESDEESETADDWDKDHPFIERKNYDQGVGIIFGLDRMGEGFTYLSPDMVFAGATALNADLHERVKKTEEYLGVSISFIAEENDEAVMYTAGSMSGSWVDDNYIFIASGEAVARLGAGDSRYMTPWDTLDAVNTEADYWDGGFMSTHTQNGHSYIASNSFIPPNAYAIAYNKSLYATAPVQRDLYSLVESGDWTVDTLLSVLNETASMNGRLAVHDLSAAGSYLTAVGFQVTDTLQIENGYTQCFNMSERRESLTLQYRKALELVTCGPSFHWDRAADPVTFIENGEILMDTRLTRDLAEKAYGKAIGVLPLPKYDRAQSEYRSLRVNAYMGLWCNQDNKQMCGEVVELLAYFSRHSEETYNRAVMGVYGKDDSAVRRDLAMLRIIHKPTHDVGLTLSNLSQCILPPFLNGQAELTANEQKTLGFQFRIAQRLTAWAYAAPEE